MIEFLIDNPDSIAINLYLIQGRNSNNFVAYSIAQLVYKNMAISAYMPTCDKIVVQLDKLYIDMVYRQWQVVLGGYR